MRVNDDDIQKAAFRTCYGRYEFVLMPFRLTNLAATFMDLMNRAYKSILDGSVTVLIDDILVYSKRKEQHEDHLREVLDTLRMERLYVKFSKCEFFLSKVQFFGNIINQKWILVDTAKIDAVMRWEVPRTTSEIQSFFACDSFDKE